MDGKRTFSVSGVNFGAVPLATCTRSRVLARISFTLTLLFVKGETRRDGQESPERRRRTAGVQVYAFGNIHIVRIHVFSINEGLGTAVRYFGVFAATTTLVSSNIWMGVETVRTDQESLWNKLGIRSLKQQSFRFVPACPFVHASRCSKMDQRRMSL